MTRPRPAADEILGHIARGTAGENGRRDPSTLVSALAAATGAAFAMLAEWVDEDRMAVLALHEPDGAGGCDEWDLAGTPCAASLDGGRWYHPSGVCQRFPGDRLLVERGADGYLGAPLLGPDGRRLGVLAVFDRVPLHADELLLSAFDIFAASAAAELDRRAAEARLRESEDRYRDLFDEAPIAYVLEDLETRFIRVNHTAMRTLGIRPDEVEGTYGRSFIPDTPSAQRRVEEAFESVGRGTDTSGVVLELRRRDSGDPLWIQWWSRPDPGGKYTRTMFVDITERVLLEQEKERLTEQNRYLQEEIKATHNFDEIVGRNPGLLAVLENVRRVAPTDASVLITGETGTGKELIARAIHSSSARRDRPLIKLNCAALPTGLVESELFGHEKGAFSGAITQRVGRFELAHGGTIFLDEIGEMPLDVQVKLLRVLQEHEFERVGGCEPIAADVRIIAATNRDLSQAIQEGRFRPDLFYRLNVFPIALPPLRERLDDIPLLVRFFLGKYTARVGKQVEGVSPQLVERFSRYPWPGNVRELQNLLERAVILTNSNQLDVDSTLLPPHAASPGVARVASSPSTSAAPSPTTEPGGRPGATLESVEREHIRATLEHVHWVIEGPQGAARVLALHPNTLRSRMKKLGLSREARGST